MDFKDYYKVLGLTPAATQEDIKRAYKKLARKYHPDVSKESDATSKFQDVSEAYEVLKNADKRAEYDDLREYVMNPNQFQRAGGTGQYTSASAQADFDDLLRSIFGDQGGVGRRSSGFDSGRGFVKAGQNLHHEISISLEEAYAGAKKPLQLMTASGSKTINLTIPKGIEEGRELRLKGQGEPGVGGGPAGNLYLKIKIQPHSRFKVDGEDTSLEVPLAPWEAALGTRLEVDTLGGRVNLKVPPNSPNGKQLRLRGRGIGGGDQFVVLNIVNPPVTTDSDRAAFEHLAAAFKFEPRAS